VELALETSPGPRGTGPLAAIREGISSAYVGNDNEARAPNPCAASMREVHAAPSMRGAADSSCGMGGRLRPDRR
jgi:hypothetical protein